VPTNDRYGSDVLSTDWRTPRHGRSVETAAELGLVVEEVQTDFCGEIVKVERGLDTVTLEDRRNRRRTFPLGPGFLLEGKPVILVAPTRQAPTAPTRTASGSIAVQGGKARVARASRIFVEGRHDAELVEKVWGDDLRLEGVVVELLDGVDNLADALRDFAPGPGRRATTATGRQSPRIWRLRRAWPATPPATCSSRIPATIWSESSRRQPESSRRSPVRVSEGLLEKAASPLPHA